MLSIKKLYLFILILSFLVVICPNALGLQSWIGNVTIGSNTSTNGAKVDIYVNSGTVITDSGFRNSMRVGDASVDTFYLLDVASANIGDNVFIKVWGINATEVQTYTSTGDDVTVRTGLNISINLSSDNEVCTYSSGCSGGFCCSGATQIDDGSASGTCVSIACTTGGGVTGGGGTSGGSAPAGGSQTVTVGTVAAGTSKTVIFSRAPGGIMNIALSVKSTLTGVQLKISDISSNPGVAKDALSSDKGGVYKYLNIKPTKLPNDEIEIAVIRFKVLKSWYVNNGYKASTTELRREVDGEWESLPTKKTGEDGAYYFFEAESPGFSKFAVIAKTSAEMTAFEIIDTIKNFYKGESAYTAFEIIDIIKGFYAGG